MTTFYIARKLTSRRIIAIGSAVILVFILISGVMAYLSPWRDPLTLSFKKLYPAAIIGSNFVSVKEADDFVSLARRADPQTPSSTAYQTFLARKKSEQLLKKMGIKLDSDAVSDELTFYTKGNEEVFSEFIRTFFNNDKNLFVDNIVYPEVVESKLQIYYNANANLNSESYMKAKSILEKLAQGQKFEDLAKVESDDKQSGQVGGDLGFLSTASFYQSLRKRLSLPKSGKSAKILS